jgi:hypothetical protein
MFVEPMTASEKNARDRERAGFAPDPWVVPMLLATIDALRANIARRGAAQNTLVLQPIAGVAGTPMVVRYGACTHPSAKITQPATAGEPMTYCPDCGLFAAYHQ